MNHEGLYVGIRSAGRRTRALTLSTMPAFLKKAREHKTLPGLFVETSAETS